MCVYGPGKAYGKASLCRCVGTVCVNVRRKTRKEPVAFFEKWEPFLDSLALLTFRVQ
jgi:hypothetical protein